MGHRFSLIVPQLTVFLLLRYRYRLTPEYQLSMYNWYPFPNTGCHIYHYFLCHRHSQHQVGLPSPSGKQDLPSWCKCGIYMCSLIFHTHWIVLLRIVLASREYTAFEKQLLFPQKQGFINGNFLFRSVDILKPVLQVGDDRAQLVEMVPVRGVPGRFLFIVCCWRAKSVEFLGICF